MNLKELYQEIILDHGKNPRNLRKTTNFNKDAKGHNPLCGDKVHVYLKLDEDKKVQDISFEGQGCAISMASASSEKGCSVTTGPKISSVAHRLSGVNPSMTVGEIQNPFANASGIPTGGPPPHNMSPPSSSARSM